MLAVIIQPGYRWIPVAHERQPDGSYVELPFLKIENLMAIFPEAVWLAYAGANAPVYIMGQYVNDADIAAFGNRCYENVYGEN